MDVIKILLIDHTEEAATLLTKLLSQTHLLYDLHWAKTLPDAFKYLKKQRVTIAVVDSVPGYSCVEILKHPQFRAVNIPTICITDQGDEYLAVQAIKAGAHNYLVKTRFDSSRLTFAIQEALREHEYKLKYEAHQIELIKLATTDELTGLLNRRHFMSRLQDEVARYTRYQTPFSVALLDVDHFKRINDTYGHEAGDVILRDLGKLIQTSIRSTDTACRYGGEEFLIAFPSTTLIGTETLSERLRLSIYHHAFMYEKMHIPVSVSIGLAESQPEINNAEMLLKLADKALYAAKKDGRNCVISYHYGAGL